MVMATNGELDVAPEQLAIVQAILREHVPDHEVWAFGSRATGTAKPFSDLDLAIITDAPLPLGTIGALEEAFTESDLSWKVDVVDWAIIDGGFRERVRETAVTLLRPMDDGRPQVSDESR